MDRPTLQETNAIIRQAASDPLHSPICARCGELLNICHFEEREDGLYPTWRKSKKDGGRDTNENCIILCKKCYFELRQNSFQEIPMKDLPFYHGKH
jgi:hypothetical protein